LNKKIILSFTIVLAFSLVFCGCGGTPKSNGSSSVQSSSESRSTTSSSAQSEKAGSAQGKLLSAGYVDIMKTGKFLIHYKASITNEGKKIEAEITTAIDGKNMANIMKASDLSTHTVFKDNTFYLLDDKNKTYFKMSAGQTQQSSQTENFENTTDLKYVGNGTGTVNGKTLPYEEYSTSDGTSLRFFMDGKNLYAITSKTKDEQMEMIILELTGKIPDGMISIPSDYKQSTTMGIPGSIDMTGEGNTDTEDE
jgi:hypothetical protein